ncbi:MAG TPA: hypothetical protein VGF69_05060 [Thermoanaerobaculia bacterium]
MTNVITFIPPRKLTGREVLQIELPAFLVRALEQRVAEANAGAEVEEETVTLDELIEFQLAQSLTIADVATMERTLPGMAAEVSRWLAEIQ